MDHRHPNGCRYSDSAILMTWSNLHGVKRQDASPGLTVSMPPAATTTHTLASTPTVALPPARHDPAQTTPPRAKSDPTSPAAPPTTTSTPGISARPVYPQQGDVDPDKGQLLANGGRVYFVKGHRRWEIPNILTGILDCADIRLSIDDLMRVPQHVIDSYTDAGPLVSCP